MYIKRLKHNPLKQFYLTLLVFALTLPVFGQSNFHKLGVGVGVGGNYSFTDVQKGGFSKSFQGNLDYFFTPFISAGLEAQMGIIKSDSKPDEHGRMFENGYKAFMLNAKVRAGQFTDFYYSDFLNYTKGAYIGTGVGYIQNNMNVVVRDKMLEDGSIYPFPGQDKSSSLMVPINLGIDFFFSDGWGDMRYAININYQTNFTFGEGLDGYDDTQTIRKNIGSGADMYNVLSVGVKYTFGFKGLTTKTMR